MKNDEQNQITSGASSLSVNEPTESLADAYEKAMELQRAIVAESGRELEIAENHLRQLKEITAMHRRHYRENATELASMEAIYVKWSALMHNVELEVNYEI